MDLKLLGATFVSVFLAELGDKTQLATLSLASAGSSRWAIFLGSSLALITTSAIAVLGGEAIARVVPPVWIQRVAGLSFFAIGGWLLWKARAGG